MNDSFVGTAAPICPAILPAWDRDARVPAHPADWMPSNARTSFIDTIALTSGDILGRRTAGAGVDDILERASEGYVADTCHGPCRTFADYSAQARIVDDGSWQSAVPESRFANDFQPADALFICHTPDGLGFAVSRFPRR